MTTTSDVGEILRPGDAEYEHARHVWNGAIDRHPALIARCRDAAEVAAAVRLGTANGLEIAVRGGGHSIPGLSVCEGGLMIDLSPMKRVEVDTDRRIARAEPGLLWADYDAGTQVHGLASPGGEISHTGVAGLTLGGGVGWLSRRHGLSCDNLVGAQLVLANGDIVEVDESTEPDLFWALRGGGGNFGIVTEFRFRVHPVPPRYAGIFMWPSTEAPRVLSRFVELAADAPRDLAMVAAQVVGPPAPFVPAELQLRPVVAVAAVWTGDPANGPDAVSSLRDLRPDVDTFGLHPYTAIQQWFDAGAPHGRRYHVRSEWLGELTSPAVDELSAAGASASSPFDQVLLRTMGGAIADVGPDDTAFRFRESDYLLTIVGAWEDGDRDPHVAWTRGTWDRMRPWSVGGGYVNHLDADEGRDRLRSAYGPATWSRLVEVKRRFDPDNVFHLNQNVDPAGR
jgi:FAD/FMN-containing dehydrogenase